MKYCFHVLLYFTILLTLLLLLPFQILRRLVTLAKASRDVLESEMGNLNEESIKVLGFLVLYFLFRNEC